MGRVALPPGPREEKITLEPRETTIRYLVRFSDGGSGIRYRDRPLDAGDEIDDGGQRYRVVRVEQPPSESSFGHAWAEQRSSGLERRPSGPPQPFE